MAKKSKQSKDVPSESVTTRYPKGIIRRMDRIIKEVENWFNRQQFIRQAVEKLIEEYEEKEQIK